MAVREKESCRRCTRMTYGLNGENGVVYDRQRLAEHDWKVLDETGGTGVDDTASAGVERSSVDGS